MKKTVLSLGLVAALASINCQADTLLGLYGGVQGWNMQTTGGFSENGNNGDFNFEDEAKSNFYVAFEHPVPLIPNIKLQRTEMDTAGAATLDANFAFGGELFSVSADVATDVQLTAIDVILYYELFDNDLVSFDFGINAKYIDGEFLVTDKDVSSQVGREEFSGAVPMLYSRLAVGVPFTGFGAYVEGSYLSFDDNTLSDYQAVITYSLMENFALDVTVQLGYRVVAIELEDIGDLKELNNIYSDLEFKGPFAGIEVHF
jgi:outer membrane protein